MNDYRSDPNRALDARFRSAIRKQDLKKTGLVKTHKYTWECTVCGTFHASGKPQVCGAAHPNPLVDKPCTNRTFKQWSDVDVEAMPLGRINTDLRSPSQMGRKGKVR